jgi:L-malate glycosyltransferase
MASKARRLWKGETMDSERRKTVGIIQARLHHFRVPFYEALRERLAERNMDLVLIYGQPSEQEKKKKDAGTLDWAIEINNRSLRLGGIEFLWQPCLKHVKACDLLVVQQENRMLVNYYLLAGRKRRKLCFWGHGMNCQSSDPSGLRERWKRLFLKAPHYWFAYTDFTKDILLQQGVDENRIAVVQNAIDTAELRSDRDSVTDSELAGLREQLGMQGRRVGVYCGSLYQSKRIDFLIEAAENIKSRIEDFELLIIGAGQDAPVAEAAAAQHPWVHYVGPQFGRDKARHLMLSSVFLVPRLVGLAILDSFVFGLPLFTTDSGQHGPEIAYLESSRNGCMTPNTVDDYANAVAEVLDSPQTLSDLAEQCRADAERYTIENMAENFAEGIEQALRLN